MRLSIQSFPWTAVFACTALALVVTAKPIRAITLRQLTRPFTDGSITAFADPVWYPDGSKLMVVGFYPDFVDSYWGTLDVDLNGEVQPYSGLTIGGRGATDPTLHPDGDHLACWAYIHLVSTGVFVTQRGNSGLPEFLAAAREPAWSPDGEWLLVSTSQGLRKLSPMPGGTSEVVTTSPNDEDPAWSPDGTRIAYSSIAGGTRDLWVKDLVDGHVKRVTADPAEDGEPSFSPDGSWIAFASNRLDGTARIWVIASTGGTPVPVAEGRSPAWSPDGRSIAFARGQYYQTSQVWIATDLPDWTLPVAPATWSQVKESYRH